VLYTINEKDEDNFEQMEFDEGKLLDESLLFVQDESEYKA
jgi:hypothetical protein